MELEKLPWFKKSEVDIDLTKALNTLDADHFGLEKVKERIIEFLAVQKRMEKIKGPILCLVGPPGVGKTSLASKLSKDLNKKLILESFDENPFLKKFYEKPNNYALNLELTFLVDRCKELNDFNNQPDLFKDGIIFDYHIQKSLIFAGVTLNETDFKLYRNIFFLMTKNIIKPDLTIFLIQSEKKLINNIKKRDRVFEQKITSQYLSKINEAYLSAFKASKEKILKIDVSDLDFVQNEMDYKKLIFRIKKNLRQRLKEFPNQYC